MRVFYITLLYLFAAITTVPAADDPITLSEQSRNIIQTFASRLQNELQQAMTEGGVVQAIDICKVRAPAIAAELSRDGWLIKRTSLKPRNPLNAPDAFERQTLLDFEAKKAQGWAVEKLAYYKMREVDDSIEFRYMKAIPVQTMCLTCHGEDIPADVLQKLDVAYPNDQARGYQAGDIRGAFSLRRHIQGKSTDETDQQARSSNIDTRLVADP